MDNLFFDIESTGLSTERDKIVQLAIMIVTEDGTVTVNKSKLYNPGIPISQSAFDAHGISDDDVKDCPEFKDDANKLKTLFENKVIIGYNIMRFDVPLLVAEFTRAGVEVDFSGKFIDVLNIEKKLNANKLEDAYRRYTGKSLEGAHDAMKDVDATSIVFHHQTLKLLDDIENKYKNEPESHHTILDETLYELSGTKEMVDLYNKLKRDNEGYLIFNFGKSKGTRVINDPSYAKWILGEEFPMQVKNMIREEQTKHALKTGVAIDAKPTLYAPPKQILKSRPAGKWQGFKNVSEDDDLPF